MVLETSRLHFGVLSDFFMIQGSTGTPSRHLEVELFMLIDVRVRYGSLLGHTLRTFCDFSMIWGAKEGDSFQDHVFGALGCK